MIGGMEMLDVESFLLGIAAGGGGGGGGNPNYVETITGTLANPFGTMTAGELKILIQNVTNGKATAILHISNTIDLILVPQESNGLYFVGITNFDSTEFDGYIFEYDASDMSRYGGYCYFDISSDSVSGDIASLHASKQTTLTIIHHPLP